MSDKMVDVTVHIDENVSAAVRGDLEDKLRAIDGIMAAASHEQKPHLMMVEYDPDVVSSSDILKEIKDAGVHAELIGL